MFVMSTAACDIEGKPLRHTGVGPFWHSGRVESQNHPCPRCGSVAVKRIVWTDDASKIGTSNDAAVVFLSGAPAWNESSGADLICSACKERFWSSPLRQKEDEDEKRRQQGRIEAMKRGEDMLFDPRTTSVEEIAHAIWQQVQQAKKASAKKPRRKTAAKKQGGHDENEAAATDGVDLDEGVTS